MRSFDSLDGAVSGTPDQAVSIPSECPSCRSSSIATTAKHPDAHSYWRCVKCGEIWNVGRRDQMRGSGFRVWR